MASRGEQANLRPLALKQRVGRNGHAVNDPLGLSEKHIEVQAEGSAQPSEPVDDTARLIVRRARCLSEGHVALRINRDDIRERASHIDSDSVAHWERLPRRVTKPSRRSRFRACSLRAAGSPQPPPPAE